HQSHLSLSGPTHLLLLSILDKCVCCWFFPLKHPAGVREAHGAADKDRHSPHTLH
ncbi:hypothetical protein WMY93_030823, partial [Mugilogobius chulae]